MDKYAHDRRDTVQLCLPATLGKLNRTVVTYNKKNRINPKSCGGILKPLPLYP